MIITATLEAMLRAMDAEPRDISLRLIFADALEESATSDGDHATVEAIRRFCQFDLTKSGLPRKPAREWLKANWERLIPQAAAKHLGKPQKTPSTSEKIGDLINSTLRQMAHGEFERIARDLGEIAGRPVVTLPQDRILESQASRDWAIRHEWKTASKLETFWRLYPDSLANHVESRTYTVKIEFHRGLVWSFRTFGQTARKQLNPLVIADQPWAVVSFEHRECPRCGLLIATNRMEMGWEGLAGFTCERCKIQWERARRNLYVQSDELSDEGRERNAKSVKAMAPVCEWIERERQAMER